MRRCYYVEAVVQYHFGIPESPNRPSTLSGLVQLFVPECLGSLLIPCGLPSYAQDLFNASCFVHRLLAVRGLLVVPAPRSARPGPTFVRFYGS